MYRGTKLRLFLRQILREASIQIALAVVALLGGIAFGFIAKVVGLDHRPTAEEIAGLVWQSTIELWPWLIQAFHRHPVVGIAVIILIILYGIGGTIARALYRRLRDANDLLSKSTTQRELLSRSGLSGQWQHAKLDGTGAPWSDLVSEIRRPENNFLLILGANGLETFGAATSPLYNVLADFTGDVRVMLAHPNKQNKFVDGRASALGMSARDYRKAIQTSVSRLRDLKKETHSIDGRFYRNQCSWKLIVTNTTMWLQYYHAGHIHVADTPTYRFDSKAEGGKSLYHFFYMEFNRLWDACHDDPMRLDQSKPT